MGRNASTPPSTKQILLASALLLLCALLFAIVFAALPIEDGRLAIDWKQIWSATHGFQARYGLTELRTPPWALPIIWPFTVFPLAHSWGLFAFATLAVLVISVPRSASPRVWLLGVFAVILAYPNLRQIIDGNLEALVIGGALLSLWALRERHPALLAIGLLLVAAKIQASWLLLPYLAYLVWRSWPRALLLRSLAWALGLAAPLLLWKGGAWLNAMIAFPWPGTLIDSSLQASLARLNAPTWLIWGAWLLLASLLVSRFLRDAPLSERSRIAALVTGGLLLGPYAASNSVLTPYALGVVPLLQRRPFIGATLAVLYSLPYLALSNPEWRFAWESTYWTAVLVITLLMLLFVENGNAQSEMAPQD